MAMSGSIPSSYGVPGNKYSPWIQLDWKITSQNVNTNKSYIDLTLWMKIEGYINYSSTMYGNLQGTGFNYSGNTGSYRWVKLSTKSIVVDHNRDGTGSVRLYASYDLKINFSGTWMKPMSVSRTVTLPTIPQASDVPHFSFNRDLNVSTQNWIDLGTKGIVAKSSGFSHRVWLMDGGTTILNLGNVSGGVRWIDLSASQVNTIIRNMPSHESKSFQLWVQTVNSSGSYVGPHVLKSATAKLHADVKPTVTEALIISIAGNGKDKAFNKYMKGISRVHGKFNGDAGYGASVSKYEFEVRKVGGGDLTTTQGRDVTRQEVLKDSGQYEAWGKITDTRGRWTWVPANGDTIEFFVEDYVAPRLTTFQVKRTSPNTTAQITVRGTWRYLGGQNRLRLIIKKRVVGGTSWTGVVDKYLNWTNSFNEILTSRNNRADMSYEYTLELKDDYGNIVNATQTISTAKVLMDLHEDKGVGIGKVHERGELDVAGDVYFEGNIELTPKTGAGGPGFKLVSQDSTGHGYIEYYGPDNTRRAYIGIPSATNENLHIYNEQGGDIRLSGKSITANGYDIWTEETVETGSNSNGNWVRFPDGTQICQHILEISGSSFSRSWGSLYYEYLSPNSWSYPKSFSSNPTVSMSSHRVNMFFANSRVYSSSATGLIAYRAVSGAANTPVCITAIGRWK